MPKRVNNKGKGTRKTDQRVVTSNNGGRQQLLQHAHEAAVRGGRTQSRERESATPNTCSNPLVPFLAVGNLEPITVANIAFALASCRGRTDLDREPEVFDISEVFPSGSLDDSFARALTDARAVRNTRKFKKAQKKAKEERKRSTPSTSNTEPRRSPRTPSTSSDDATEGQTAEEPQRHRQ